MSSEMPDTATRAYQLTDHGRLSTVDPAKILAADARGTSHYWVDLTSPSRQELERWTRALAVPELLADLVVDPAVLSALGEPASGAVVLDAAAYFFLPFFGTDGFAEASPFAGLCTPTVLLTFHAHPLPMLQAAVELATRGDLLPTPTVSGLVSTLTRYCSRRSVDGATRLRARLNKLAQRIAQGDAKIDPGELLECDELLQVLDTTVDEQLASLRLLVTARSSALDMASLADHGAVALSNLETLGRSVDRLERRAGSIRSQYDSLLAERSNRRISALTIVSALFMPATLIAGIYGMNFDEMPALHIRYGYQIALLTMGLSGAGGLLLFWRRGWFR